MPRFDIKALLIGFAVIALWLSTVNGHAVGSDVRDAIMLAIAAVSLLGVIYYRGRRRAFWTGFLIAILAMGVNALPNFQPQLYWINSLLRLYGQDRDVPTGATNYVYVFFNDTIRALVTMLLAISIGYIATRIYDHSQRAENQ